jgi:hypothetical protein
MLITIPAIKGKKTLYLLDRKRVLLLNTDLTSLLEKAYPLSNSAPFLGVPKL